MMLGGRTISAIKEKGRLKTEMTMSTKPFLKSSSFMFRTKTDFNWKKKNLLCLAFCNIVALGKSPLIMLLEKAKWNGTVGDALVPRVLAMLGATAGGWVGAS